MILLIEYYSILYHVYFFLLQNQNIVKSSTFSTCANKVIILIKNKHYCSYVATKNN